jgi:hypothetical protein
MKIKFTDLNKINKKYLSAIKISFSNIVKKDKFIGGKIVKNFEDKLNDFILDVRDALARLETNLIDLN